MNKRKKSRVGLLIFLCLIVYFTYVIINQQHEINAKFAELKSIQEKIRQEKELGEQLKREKEKINTDEYNEKIAREKLGLVKSGEKVFVDIGN